MKSKNMYIINVGLTCLTMILLLTTCSGCTTEQLTEAQAAIESVKPALNAAALPLEGQPWYIIALIFADIATSVLAAYKSHVESKNIKKAES